MPTYKYDPKFCEMLIAHMAKGNSFMSFGAKLFEMGVKVSRKTLYEWRDQYPEWAEAHGVGKLLCLSHWEDIGYAGATGQAQIQPTIYIYKMKCRFGEFGYNEQRPVDDDKETSNAELDAMPTDKILTLIKSRK